MADPAIFELGDVKLQSGAMLKSAQITYTTYGELNAAGDNAVVFPTHMTGRHENNEWLIAEGMALDPRRYVVIVPNMFGNGLSTSPSRAAPDQSGPRFPGVSIADNVRCQHRLVTSLGVGRLALAVGYSMGALQAYEWACAYPDMVERLAPICGAARVSPHNNVMLAGVKAALTASDDFLAGNYIAPPSRGLAAFARVYIGWVFSQAFYRERLFTAFGFDTPEAFLSGFAEPYFGAWDANDLLAKIWTWQHADISAERHDGDFAAALRSIKAKTLALPCETDLYFRFEDNEAEVAHMPNASCRPIPSIWGHVAGGGMNAEDGAFINRALVEILAS